jgi:hypothetical protein
MNGMLRFCYECKHRRIVDGLPNGEFRCEQHPEIRIFNTTDADKCINEKVFEEIKGSPSFRNIIT